MLLGGTFWLFLKGFFSYFIADFFSVLSQAVAPRTEAVDAGQSIRNKLLLWTDLNHELDCIVLA